MKNLMGRACVVIVLCATIFGCKEKITDPYQWQTQTTFHFPTRNQTVSISPEATLLTLKANYPEQESGDVLITYPIVVIPEKTTAIADEHYTIPSQTELAFKFKPHTTTSSLEIALIPANITKPLQIAFTAKNKYPKTNYKKYDDTTIVMLVPLIE